MRLPIDEGIGPLKEVTPSCKAFTVVREYNAVGTVPVKRFEAT